MKTENINPINLTYKQIDVQMAHILQQYGFDAVHDRLHAVGGRMIIGSPVVNRTHIDDLAHVSIELVFDEYSIGNTIRMLEWANSNGMTVDFWNNKNGILHDVREVVA